MKKLTEQEIFTFLAKYDTPTICNAIEIAEGRRTNKGFTKGNLVCANPKLPSFVGYALTAKIQGSQKPKTSPAIINKLRMDYYRYVAEAGKNSVLVIEDLDTTPIAAFWGELNVAIHKKLGIKGVLTNGALRDLDSLASNFQVLAGALSPSHAFVHLVDLDCKVKVFSLQIKAGDIIHADRHGAVIIEKKYLQIMPECVNAILEKEAPILKACREKNFDLTKLQKVWRDFSNYKPKIQSRR